MEGIQAKPGEIIGELAKDLKSLDTRLSELNAEVESLKSRREDVSNKIVAEVEKMAGDGDPLTAIEIEGVGVIKLETTPHPRILDIESFIQWCSVNEAMAPQISVNPKTLQSWWKEQDKINRPLPGEGIASVFWKTRAKINRAL